MSAARFVIAMAWRQARGSRRTLSLALLAVATGVAALVAIRSFGDAVQAAVRAEARALLGADLVAHSAAPFSAAAEQRLRELLRDAPGAGTARVTSFGTMALAVEVGTTRLVQVTAFEEGYPFYGEVNVEPAGAWAGLGEAHRVLVEPALFEALGVRLGAPLALGEARFEIAGVVRRFPGDLGVRSALGPRVFIARRFVEETRLVGFGARVRHELVMRLPPGVLPGLLTRYRGPLAAERVNLRTVDDDQQRIGDGLARLGTFLSLVGLVALLLGGIGVASAVHVLVKRQAAAIAVLRSLGATGRRVVLIFVVQAAVLGLLGGLLGTLLGLLFAAVFPWLVGELLPVAVSFGISWPAVVTGLGVGTLASALFALPALLRVRHVSPLAALRSDYGDGPARARDRVDMAAIGALALTVLILATWHAGTPAMGAAFALGLGATLGALALLARALRAVLRRRLSPALPYVWRQGLASLHRPAKQTMAVVLALGFGVFLLATLLVLERNLLRDLDADAKPERPNLAFFDIQNDQRQALDSLLREAGARSRPAIPIVPMRLASLKGRRISELLGRMGQDGRPDPRAWAWRREYRSSYRDTLGAAEAISAGSHWKPGAWRGGPPGEPVPVSLDASLAEDLEVRLGDEIVWDVQGVELWSRVASLRRIHWARLEPNFFAVFPDGPLADAPQSWVTLVRLDDASARGRLEGRVVQRLPNVSALDLADVQRALDGILDRVGWAIRFMALFSGGVGACVLLGAVAASREQRLREAVLLKTLGATRTQVWRIVLAEYACLGALASAAGVLLSLVAGWALLRYVFETEMSPPLLSLAAFGLAVAVLAAVLGGAASREVFRQTALQLLRAE